MRRWYLHAENIMKKPSRKHLQVVWTLISVVAIAGMIAFTLLPLMSR